MSQYDDVDFSISEDWAKHKDFKKPFLYTLDPITDPETGDVTRKRGQKLLIRRVEMPDLLKAGLAQELDFMTKEIMKGDDKPQSKVIKDAINKADAYLKMEAMVNTVCLAGIIKPKIQAVPVHDNARQPGQIYIDEIPWDDRQELFSVIFESEGLSDFREEQADDVGNVADVQSVQLPADGPVGDSEEHSEGVLSQ